MLLRRLLQQILQYGPAPEATPDPKSVVFTYLCISFLSNYLRTTVCFFFTGLKNVVDVGD